MGRSRQETTSEQTTQQDQTQTITPTATAEEQELNRLDLDARRATQDDFVANQLAALGLSTDLIQGIQTGVSDSPILSQILGGISPETIGGEAARVAQRAQPGFQALGLGESGVAFRETADEVAQSVLFPAEQFNILNALSATQLGFSGATQAQQPVLTGGANLGARLAGLRPITTTGQGTAIQTGTTQVTSPNPFFESFQQSLGNNLSSPQFSAGPFQFGG